MTIEIGSEAPDFELRDDEGQMFKLSDMREKKNVLLLFYPAALSPGCHSEFCTLRDENPDLVATEDLEIVGISTDHVWSLKAWKERDGFKNRFVADFWPHGEVATAYGAFLPERGVAARHTFLIDKQGIVRYVERNSGRELRDQNNWRTALKALG